MSTEIYNDFHGRNIALRTNKSSKGGLVLNIKDVYTRGCPEIAIAWGQAQSIAIAILSHNDFPECAEANHPLFRALSDLANEIKL